MQNFPNNIVPTSLYCNKYYTRCAAACQCASDGRSLTGQSTVPSTRVWRITSATRKTLWRLRAAATPSSATMGPRELSSGHHFCGGAAETDGTVHRSLSCTSDIKATPISQKAEWPADMYPLYWTPSRGGIIMRYTYEYKRKCVELYREGKWPETPEGVSDKSFRDKVRLWVRAEDSRGPEALKHKNFNRNWTPEERLELVSQVMSGKSCVSVAIEAGIQDRLLYQWVQNYKTKGYNGLVEMKKGRPSKGVPQMKKEEARPLNESEREELIRLRAENEYIKAENEVIKKEIALREERHAAQLKARKQRSSKSCVKKDTN